MSWNGVKKQSYEQEIKSWCDKMGIKKYTINSQGEIDVNGYVDFYNSDLKELPYKFGSVRGHFTLGGCKNLTSLKNCPNEVGGYFSCGYCKKLDSLKGCPQKVYASFYCNDCKRKFTEEEMRYLCKAKRYICN